ncbi:hypothetical protein Rhal01_03455 [Rubritalea halochordaticola]|uniref:Uncharacterized protein n=1 Tax=Rubritalea halochordaticola TaxID=714537 RepID=A0ABP9V3M6_9BACT
MNRLSFILLPALLLVSCERQPMMSVTRADDPMPEKVEAESYLLAYPGHLQMVGNSVDVTETYAAPKVLMEAVNEEKQKRAVMSQGSMTRERRFWLQCNTADSMIVYPLKVDMTNVLTMGGKKLEVPELGNPLKGKTVKARWDGKTYTWEPMGKEEEAVMVDTNKIFGAYDAEIYGTKPRRPGESWSFNPAHLLPFPPEDVSFTGEASMKFEKVQFFRGYQCAYFSFEVDSVGSSQAGEDHVKARGRVIRALDYGVDLYMAVNIKSRAKLGLGSTGDSSYSMNRKIVLPNKVKARPQHEERAVVRRSR